MIVVMAGLVILCCVGWGVARDADTRGYGKGGGQVVGKGGGGG